MKVALVVVLLSTASFGILQNFKQATQSLTQKYSYCKDIKKLSRKKVLALSKRSSAAHDEYLSCKHLKKNKETDFMTRCKYKNGRYQVRGLKSYGGILSPIKLPFRYDIYTEGNQSVIEVRIYFKDRDILKQKMAMKHTPEETHGYYKNIQTYSDMMDFYLQKSSEFWSEFSPNQDIKFHFVQVNKRSQAHFKVGLVDKNKGILYNYKWNTFMRQIRDRNSRRLIDRTMAHEIGHMLGLEDEYSRTWGTLSGKYFSMFHNHYKKDCSTNSLMCTPVIMWTTQNPIVQDYHYYQIFKRANKC